MNEVEKLYENCNIKPKQKGYCDWGSYCPLPYNKCDDECPWWKYENKAEYPPFTAEKQIEIENVILQNKKNYNKWIEYNINVYGEWVIRFVRTDKFAPYIALGKTRAEAFANVINHSWQDLTEEECKQIRGILE